MKRFQSGQNNKEGTVVEQMIHHGTVEDGAAKLEVALVAWIAEHNLSMSIMNDLPQLLKSHVNDSEIIKKIACGRTKATGLLKNVVARFSENELVETLKKSHFSIIVDETTDRTSTKFMV